MASFLEKYGPWAVVTGASGGLGDQFTHQLAEKGFNIVLTARSKEDIENIAKETEQKYDVKTLCISADLTNDHGINAILTATADLDVGLLVNNAGILYVGSFFRQESSDFTKLISLNVTAVTTLAHAFGRRFIKRGKGGILFVASAARKPIPWMAVYSASKAFVANLAYILHMELESYGINVMSLEPGLVTTEMTENNLQQTDMSSNTPQNVVSDALDAFEKGSLRITPARGLDEQENSKLIESLEETSEKMTSQMDQKLFKPVL